MNEEDAAAFISSVIEKYKRIDAAVLTAGGFAMRKITDTKAFDIYKQNKLNFETAYHVARPVFVRMLKQNTAKLNSPFY